MKTLNITFENYEHRLLTHMKGNRTWRDFILTLTNKKEEEEKTNNNLLQTKSRNIL